MVGGHRELILAGVVRVAAGAIGDAGGSSMQRSGVRRRDGPRAIERPERLLPAV